ncbi:sugar transferase [Acidimicrobiia bacterium EGI L10123]|uniref:sugar transferase n=1 Tax=Salinilacustrithrix flava TaxID=2957203 RepID=UPI003D7C176A|nr:sugar transferase [Acidimicrobiia bacterium EGI L10123]
MRDLRRAHRALEILVALAMAVVTLPILAATLLISAAVYRAWPIFVHQRVGRDGVLFPFPKVRTLPPATSAYADKHAIGGEQIPAVMRAIRRIHLDELLQLWLVVSGRMALVGPRPEMAVLHRRLAPIAAAERTSVRPGVTGLWQVSVHCDGLICDRIEYDRLYVQHHNPLLDGWILWRTAQKMLLGRRVHLFDVPRWAIPPVPCRGVPLASSSFIDLTATEASTEQPAAKEPALSVG